MNWFDLKFNIFFRPCILFLILFDNDIVFISLVKIQSTSYPFLSCKSYFIIQIRSGLRIQSGIKQLKSVIWFYSFGILKILKSKNFLWNNTNFICFIERLDHDFGSWIISIVGLHFILIDRKSKDMDIKLRWLNLVYVTYYLTNFDV